MNLRIRQGYQERPDEFPAGVTHSIELGETGKELLHTLDRNQQWFLEATVRIEFWANRAQRDAAAAVAAKALRATLYQELIAEAHACRLAIVGGNKTEALNRINAIVSMATGG